ncbi:sodium-dependent nutrient amino acid transporter 1 [Drosophila pseudoobscura]|uniref:Transporter n=1 Tax=Drosophila pseudoobscura pseudoobscura TaxID=46245 RepID=Q29F70_DROPS|nr:sodium-dependent nutrient amino acid transporter 1 [Drosophila pseudoobscura]XP_015042505.1 sodium-dependent nutrient amino acid transporter 1 [Drosophila pseudoobscura]
MRDLKAKTPSSSSSPVGKPESSTSGERGPLRPSMLPKALALASSEEMETLQPDLELDLGSRDNWGSSMEFLMSCIALSVGLGNVWRFPFTALENGGGAFLVPYLTVLFVVGKPIYYMEMLLGQFSSRGIVQVFDFAPLMRGVGYAQLLALGVLATYYASVMALTLRYFFDSFSAVLPWSYCRPEWGDGCVSAASDGHQPPVGQLSRNFSSSSQLYLQRIVLNETQSLSEQGIGYPSGSLALMLALSWLTVTLIIIRGVKSSGKASYVLALFPYAVMFILLVRSLTLPGAYDGVMYFLTPQWDKLLEPEVWYNAVTQVFFSLAVCFGVIIMYSSYNRFGHNVYRDANIVTTLDTFTSLLSGVIIFGILGNLAYESGTKDIGSVVKAGPGLAFISYPEAIAKFKMMPQIFSLLFFGMLFMLGVGSNVGMVSCIMTVLKDRFVNARLWLIVVGLSLVGFIVGLIYITPGGQHIITLLDFHGVTFVSLVSAIFELVTVGWIYGTKRLCQDAEYMLNIKTSKYYRICWSIVTPLVMTVILFYTLFTMRPLSYNGQEFPLPYRVFGWSISAFIIGQLFYWAWHANYKQPKGSLKWRISNSAKPHSDWGPLDSKQLIDYQNFRRNQKDVAAAAHAGLKQHRWLCYSVGDRIFG